MGYNAADDLVEMRKYTVDGGIFTRAIEDPDVVDTVVDKWVKYRKWQEKGTPVIL